MLDARSFLLAQIMTPEPHPHPEFTLSAADNVFTTPTPLLSSPASQLYQPLDILLSLPVLCPPPSELSLSSWLLTSSTVLSLEEPFVDPSQPLSSTGSSSLGSWTHRFFSESISRGALLAFLIRRRRMR